MQTDGERPDGDVAAGQRKGRYIRRYSSELARQADAVALSRLVDKRYIVLPVRGLGPTLFCFRYYSAMEQEGQLR
jgi:hypothetical protein